MRAAEIVRTEVLGLKPSPATSAKRPEGESSWRSRSSTLAAYEQLRADQLVHGLIELAETPACPWCGDSIERADKGRPRKWCSDACRMASVRYRQQ